MEGGKFDVDSDAGGPMDDTTYSVHVNPEASAVLLVGTETVCDELRSSMSSYMHAALAAANKSTLRNENRDEKYVSFKIKFGRLLQSLNSTGNKILIKWLISKPNNME